YLGWWDFSIRYVVSDRHLSVACGGVKWMVPLGLIIEVYAPGEAVEGRSVVVRWRGIAPFVPGYVVGKGRSEQLGNVLSVATVPAHGQVFVCTRGVTFGLSPRDPAGFIAALEEKRRFG